MLNEPEKWIVRKECLDKKYMQMVIFFFKNEK